MQIQTRMQLQIQTRMQIQIQIQTRMQIQIQLTIVRKWNWEGEDLPWETLTIGIALLLLKM